MSNRNEEKTPKRFLAKDLRPGDVVRLEGGRWAARGGCEGVEVEVDTPGPVSVRVLGMQANCSAQFVNDTDWPFVLVRRAGETPQAPPAEETFTARVGTWLWACAKAEEGEVVEAKYINGGWFCEDPSQSFPLEYTAWRVKPPEPPPPPTLEECLDVLASLENGCDHTSGSAWDEVVINACRRARDLLHRAGRIK